MNILKTNVPQLIVWNWFEEGQYNFQITNLNKSPRNKKQIKPLLIQQSSSLRFPFFISARQIYTHTHIKKIIKSSALCEYYPCFGLWAWAISHSKTTTIEMPKKKEEGPTNSITAAEIESSKSVWRHKRPNRKEEAKGIKMSNADTQ